MKKRTLLVLALGLTLAGTGSGIYAFAHQPDQASRAEQVSNRDGEIQPPPRPPREKPLERVIVETK